MVDERVQEQLDALAARLGRGLTVDSPEGELIAYSAHPDDADPARVTTILSRRVAPEVLAWEEQHLSPDATGPTVVPANASLRMTARLCVPLRRRGRAVGLLWMVHDGPLPDADEAALLEGAETLSPLLLDRSRRSEQGTSTLLRRVVEEGDRDAYEELTDRRPRVGAAPIEGIALAVDTGAGLRRWTVAERTAVTQSIERAVRSRPGALGGYVTPSYALLVSGVADAGAVAGLARDAVRAGLSGGDRVASGRSDPAELSPGTAPAVRDQALWAMELGVLDPALPDDPSWSDLGGYRSLIVTGSGFPQDSLTRLDQAPSSAMLLATLECYLDLGGDIRATAARLQLHRSSLYYRLERIAHHLEGDLRSGLARLELHLALKSRRIERATVARRSR